MTYLTLSPQMPALFMTSLIQTSEYKLVAVMVAFGRLSNVDV